MANEYLKPQTPLKDLNSENYFYPLTTLDQIIIGNSRLSAYLQENDGKLIFNNIDEDSVGGSIKLDGIIANRTLFVENDSLLSSENIFINNDSLAINKTSITDGYNFEVNGNSYLHGTLLTQGARIQKVTIIPGQDGATTAGWRRCCSIESIYNYGNFLMFLSGGWNSGAPTVATLSFNLRNGQASISIVHCGFVGRITKIRLVKDDSATNKYWLDCYDEGAYDSTAPLYATFIGNVNINNITTNNEIYSTTVTAAAEITLITLAFDSSGYVTLTTNQIITGQKTFSNTITGDILSTWHILAGRPSNTTNFRTYFETISNLHHDNPARTDSEISYNRFFASNSDQTTYGPGALNLPVVDQHVLSFGIDNNVVYSRHIALDIRTNKMFLGGRVNNTWQAWSEVIVHDLAQTITGVKTFSNANPIIQNNTGRATLEIKTIGNDANDLWMSTNNAHRWSLSARPSGESYAIGMWAANATAGWVQKWFQDKHSEFYGEIKIIKNGNALTIGSLNNSYCHFESSANIPFYFNKTLQINGQVIQYSSAVTSESWINGRNSAAVKVANFNNYHAGLSMKTTNGSWEIGVYTNNNLWFNYCTDANYNAHNNSVTQAHIDSNAHIWGAVWNDYAEMRNVPIANDYKPNGTHSLYAGRCVYENGDDTMSLTFKRLQKGCKIISDTFGFNIGETEKCKTPIAVSGRALVYLLEDRDVAKKSIGEFVCSGPNGTVSIMTLEEYQKYPQAVVGIISAVPDYETWGTGNIKVNNRIWIYVR